MCSKGGTRVEKKDKGVMDKEPAHESNRAKNECSMSMKNRAHLNDRSGVVCRPRGEPPNLGNGGGAAHLNGRSGESGVLQWREEHQDEGGTRPPNDNECSAARY